MSRRFTLVTVTLTAIVAFLVGAILAGGSARSTITAGAPATAPAGRYAVRPSVAPLAAPPLSFADIVERINPAVVNIDATSRGRDPKRRRGRVGPPESPDPLEGPDFGPPRGDTPRRGAGSGFIIDADGSILTNHHVVERAERIIVKLSDGRTFRARVIGADPDTDIALIKVDGQTGLPVAPLGDSSTLRMGEWVCAIGNPLGYEHSVTVGVVSFLGRKLFDMSLDDYIQTDAAINFGNSGGPLINGRGEVVGINAAISQRASNIGFAVPINEATAILPQLKSDGHVSRGFMGVTLTDVDPDLQASLKLGTFRGALVQDVAAGSPGQRAGLHVYDLITAIDGKPVAGNDEIIREVARRGPGTIAQIQIMRDGRQQVLTVRLSERPSRQSADALDPTGRGILPAASASPLGMTVRDIDRDAARRLRLPDGISGALVTRVEPLSAAWDAGIQRDYVVLEINRRPVDSADVYNRLTRAVHPGDVLAVYVYVPGLDQRAIRAVRVDAASGNPSNR